MLHYEYQPISHTSFSPCMNESSNMRILIFSDMNWGTNSLSTNLSHLITLVGQVAPDAVLLGGDLVDNAKSRARVNGSPYWNQVAEFIDFLEKEKIHCGFVRGNWDEVEEYDALSKQSYQFAHETSLRSVTLGDVRVFGIPNSVTRSRVQTTKLVDILPSNIDIILSHADGRRRIWLFELPARIILSGHFDEKLCVVRGKLFISSFHFPDQYAVIEYQSEQITASYFCRSLDLRSSVAALPPYSKHVVRFSEGAWKWETDQSQAWARC